jgi:HEAT repeat protein
VAHDVQALIRLLPAVPEHARRTVSISVRRYLNRPVLEALIQMALRTPEEQARVGEVLHWCGLDAAELMLEEIRHAEAVGPRAFLIDALGQMPEAYPLVLPLLGSPKWHEVRHGAELLGRFGNPGAIPGLKAQLQHADERVRLAAIEALSHFSDKTVLEPLRQALSHPSAVTRSHAGQALARRGSSALAMPLLVALEGEQDAVVWRELLGAMARMEAPEATAALVRLATERKSWFRRHGHSLHQRLEVVAALAASPSHSARQALERVAIEGDRTVREAARQALAKTSGAS